MSNSSPRQASCGQEWTYSGCKQNEGVYKWNSLVCLKFIRANLWTITVALKLCLVYRSNIYRACLSLVSSHDPAIPAPSLNIQGFQRMRIMRIPVKARTISFIHPGSSEHSREDSSQRETALQKLPETINSPAPGVRSLWRWFTAVITVEKVPPFCLLNIDHFTNELSTVSPRQQWQWQTQSSDLQNEINNASMFILELLTHLGLF